MFILIETIIENNGSYDGSDFAFDTEVSFQDVRFFATKEEALAAAKAELEGKRGLLTENSLSGTLIYEFYAKGFSGPKKIVAFKAAEIQEK